MWWQNYMHNNKILLQWRSLQIQDGTYGYVKIWKRYKFVKFTSQKFQNLLCAPCCSNYFLANYYRISLLSSSWSRMSSLVFQSTKDLAPCCKFMAPSSVPIKFNYTKWQCEVVHSFSVPFFSNVSTTYSTEHCPLLHCSQQEPSCLVIDYIRNDVLCDLLFQESGQNYWTDQIFSCAVTIA